MYCEKQIVSHYIALMMEQVGEPYSFVRHEPSQVQTHASLLRDSRVKSKTYNRRDSQMVTHSSTSRPVQCLCMAERTGCPVFTDLWSYVMIFENDSIYRTQLEGKSIGYAWNNGVPI